MTDVHAHLSEEERHSLADGTLDPERRAELARTVRTLVEGGRTVLAATHDADFVRGCADRVLLLEAGRIAREGSAGPGE